MSLKAMVWVMEHSAAKLGDRLALLALAENADDDGRDAYPSVATIAGKAGLSVRQTQRCLRNLEEAGRISSQGTSRFGTTIYDLSLTDSGGDNMSGGDILSKNRSDMSPEPSFEPSFVSESSSHALVIENEARPQHAREALGKVDRRKVEPEHENRARRILVEWNALTGQSLTSRDWLKMIVMRIREHPELGIEEHAHVIHAALADPWWTGHPSPSVVYGKGTVFEQALHRARSGPAAPRERNGTMRYGRGMTTQQILDATQGR